MRRTLCVPVAIALSALALIFLCSGQADAEPVRVAVAANFLEPCRHLALEFTRQSGFAVSLSSGSSGGLYAQIRNGAPFQVFLSADQERPRLLEQEGSAVPGSRFTYAVGVLVLWSAEAARVDSKATEGDIARLLSDRSLRHIAIANPDIAPYGLAAEQAMQALGVWERVQPLLVRGQDVSQTLSFGATGNAELAFVPLSLVRGPVRPMGGSYWQVPERLHARIRQDAVLLDSGAQHPGAKSFVAFLRSPSALATIRSYGYRVDSNPYQPVK